MQEKYLEAVRSELPENIAKHSLALEACLGAVYDCLQTDDRLGSGELSREDWCLAGLIHDIDYAAAGPPAGGGQHPLKTRETLAKYDLEISDEVLRVVQAHAPEITGVQPESQAEWAIFGADSLTGLIVAVALVMPTKKLADVKLKSVVKRFLKEPRFAAGTRREEVKLGAEKLGIELERFIGICLVAMQGVAGDLGL